MLKTYLTEHNITQDDFAAAIGITSQALRDIFKNHSSKTRVMTAMRIKQLTGLEPEEYLDGLDDFVKLKMWPKI